MDRAAVVMVLIVTVFGLFALGICHAIVCPLERASHRRGAWHFYLADFLCLFVIIQVPISLIHAIGRANDALLATCLVLDGVAMVASGGSWLFGVLLLSRAGIHTIWHRAVALVVVLPLAWVGSLASAAMSAWLYFAPLVPVSRESASWSWRKWALVFMGNAALLGALYGARRFTLYIVRSSQPAR
jgi:hypothetical protein